MNSVEDIYPLSPMQQGMLFHILCASDSGIYIEQVSLSIEGRLKAREFERAWQRIVDRHSVFRTTFVTEDLDEPLQIVRKRVRFNVEERDWRGVSPAEQRDQFEAFRIRDRERGFKLNQAPLMRGTLIRISEQEWIFLWSYYHLLLDAWSLSLVLKEVFAFHQAFSQGGDLELEQPPPYRHYIAWLRRQDMTQARSYWQRTLRGFTAATLPSIDHAPGSKTRQGLTYNRHEINLPLTTTTALQSLARKYQLTLNTIVQGTWALLLSRYSGEPDVMFGATVSGRPAAFAGIEAMVGLFINTLPVRVRTDMDISLLAWLKLLQEQQAEMREYENTPLTMLQEWSEIPRGAPLFENILVFENTTMGGPSRSQYAGLNIRNAIHYESRTNYPLTLVAEPGRGLTLSIVFDNQRFESADIVLLLKHFGNLLESIIDDPTQRLDSVQMLTSSERYQLLSEWNNTKTR